MRKIICIISSITVIFLYTLYRINPLTKATTHYPTNKTIHIYFDGTTVPTLFQVINLIKQPRDEIKFVSWMRYNQFISPQLINKYNIKTFKYIDFHSAKWFAQNIEKIKKLYPNNQYLIYANLSNSQHVYRAYLSLQSSIKQISFYEDSIGCSLWFTPYHTRMKNKILPATYYVSFLDKLIHQNAEFNKDNIVNINLYDEFNSLSSEQKKDFFEFLGLDIRELEKIVRNKEFAVFLDQAELNKNTALKTIKNLIKKKPELQNMIWLYKNHPHYQGKLLNELKKILPNIHYIDNKIPFEILSLAKFSPKYVIGYSSSSFFNLKHSQILKYIKRTDDEYLPYLKRLGIITDQQVINN